MNTDPFVSFKAAQKEGWALFAPLETFTTIPAGKLVHFSQLKSGQNVLDVGCGTGVVAVTAARLGARVKALDLSPVLLERARFNSKVSNMEIEFTEGDVEALPYLDSSFDVVLSQFGHMFAPQPIVAVKEMLRVLKPGGTIAFSTWPPEHFTGLMFILVGRYLPPPPGGTAIPAPTPLWGDPNIIRERLGNAVANICFDRDVSSFPLLSIQHVRNLFEQTAAPVIKLVSLLKEDSKKLQQFYSEFDALIAQFSSENILRQHFLMTRASKK